jgi:hypothetical protein
MKVRKRPVEVEAFQWDGTEASALVIINWAKGHETEIWYREDIHPDTEEGLGTYHLTIHTLEGDMIARPGYWIIKGVENEFYGCEPDIFAKTYADFQLERNVEERLTDLMTDLAKIHKPIDEDIRECTEDVENWPCPTIKAIWRARA